MHLLPLRHVLYKQCQVLFHSLRKSKDVDYIKINQIHMRLFNYHLYLILIWQLYSSCNSNESSQREQNSEYIEDSSTRVSKISKSRSKVLSDLTSRSKQSKPVKSVVVLNQDTIKITDDGKVFQVTTVNDSIYYYKLFKESKPESDLGSTIVKVKNKNNQLLWKIPVEDKIILSDSNSLITIDFSSRCINYYSIFDGKAVSETCLPSSYTLSDANDFVATYQGLYIKLVNESDYSFKDVLYIDKGSLSLKLMNLKVEGYLKLQKSDNRVTLIDNENKVVKEIK